LLCRSKKGEIDASDRSVTLLGGAWSQDLDGGDPLLDRSCLFNTARRTVLAQSMLDIAEAGNTFKV
jgi:hypothetical protein